MKYFSFLLTLCLAATISYGGTVAGDEKSSVETKDLTVHGKVTLDQPLVLDQDGFIAGLRYGNETNNIQRSIVLGNGAGTLQTTEINDSIVIGTNAANSDNATFQNMIIIGNNSGKDSKLENSLIIGNYAGFNVKEEANSVFIDTYDNEPAHAYCGTNDAIYIHNGEVNLGRGEADELIVNRLRGKWEIDALDGNFVRVSGDTMDGSLTNSMSITVGTRNSSENTPGLYSFSHGSNNKAPGNNSFAGGKNADASRDNTFVWNASSTPYNAQGSGGTFNINPDNTIEGFFIGDKNLKQHITEVAGDSDKYVQKSGDTMSGALINEKAITVGSRATYPVGTGTLTVGENNKASGINSFAGGKNASATRANTFVWNALSDSYAAQGIGGTFNINPDGGINGFYVGSYPLYTYFLSYTLDRLNKYTALTSGERTAGFNSGVRSVSVGIDNIAYQKPHPSFGIELYIKPNDDNIFEIVGHNVKILYRYVESDPTVVQNIQNQTVDGSMCYYKGFHAGDALQISTAEWTQDMNKYKPDNVTPNPNYLKYTTTGEVYDGAVISLSGEYLSSIKFGIRPQGAVGDYSIASGQSCLAVGNNSIASGKYSASIGEASSAHGDNCFSYGVGSSARGKYSTAMGEASIAEGDNCFAFGTNAYAAGAYSHAIGDYSYAQGDHTIAKSNRSYAIGQYTIATSEYAYVWNGVSLGNLPVRSQQTPAIVGAQPRSQSPSEYEDLDKYYPSHGDGTYSINPINGTEGFWIGETNLYTHILNISGGGGASLEQLKQLMGTSGYNSSMNTLNSTIDNVNCMWNVLGQWCGYQPPLSSANKSTKIKDILFSDGSDEQTDFVKRDIIINSIQVVNGGSGYTPSTTTITVDPADYYRIQPEFTVTCENGVIKKVTVDNTKCTMNFRTEKTLDDDIRLIVTGNGSGAQLSVSSKKQYPYPQAEYIGLKWGATKFINSGTDYPEGNLNIFGVSAELTGASCNKDENNNPAGDCMVWHVMVGDNGDALKSDITYDPLAGANSFTLMTWIKREDECETAARIIADLAGTRYGDGIEFSLVSSATVPQIRVNPTSPGTRVGDGCQKIDGFSWPSGAAKTSWHHIAMVYKSSDNSVSWYFDGILKQTKSYTNDRGSVKENSYPLTLGNISGNNSDNSTFVGRMDDVRIFKNWTPSDITLTDNRNKDIAYWMDKNDYYTTVPEIIDPIELGDMDKDVKVYSATQVDEIFHNQPVSGQVLTLGQLNKKTKIYTADQILSRRSGDSPTPSVMDISEFSTSIDENSNIK